MSNAAGGRRASRERALSLLYEAEAKERPPSDVLVGLPVTPDAFTIELVEGVDRHADELDELITRFARGWRLERMPVLDRTVLRMATFELVHRADVPTAAIISEAVELAKRFSTDNSGRFVNGLLSSIAGEVRPGVDPSTSARSGPKPAAPSSDQPPRPPSPPASPPASAPPRDGSGS